MKQFGDILNRQMTIGNEQSTLEGSRLMRQLKARARDITPDTRDDGSAKEIIETMTIVLTSS